MIPVAQDVNRSLLSGVPGQLHLEHLLVCRPGLETRSVSFRMHSLKYFASLLVSDTAALLWFNKNLIRVCFLNEFIGERSRF